MLKILQNSMCKILMQNTVYKIQLEYFQHPQIQLQNSMHEIQC